MLRLIIILFSIFISEYAISSDYRFYNINEKFGISVRETASVCKDDDGFIWASAKSCILRISEDDYKTYNLPFFTNDALSVKLEFFNHKLIACTSNGQFFIYNEIYDSYDRFFDLKELCENKYLHIKNYYMDTDDNIWIATSFGLFKYDHAAKNAYLVNDLVETTSVNCYDDDSMIVSNSDGLWLINRHNERGKFLCQIPPFISKIFYDKKNDRCIIGYLYDGICIYSFANKSISHGQTSYTNSNLITDIEQISDSTYLISSDGQGIWEVDSEFKAIHYKYEENIDDIYSLKGNGVYDIFYDNESDILWVSTYTGGISYASSNKPVVTSIAHITNSVNSLSDNNVNDIIEDRDGNIWFATETGIDKWNRTKDKWSTFYKNKSNNTFFSLHEDSDGLIWGGTFKSGIFVLDRKSGRQIANYTKDNIDSFYSNSVFEIEQDKEGNIWMGGAWGDVICHNYKSKKFHAFPRQPVYAFKDLNDKEIILGCSNCLCILNKNDETYNILLDKIVVKDLHVDDQYIWVCTDGIGLIKYNISTHETGKLDISNGLPSNNTNGIIESNGYLWVGTENGLCRISPDDNSISTFPSHPLLSGLSFNRQSYCLLKNGDLMWGTNKGAICFNPANLEEESIKGRIYVEDINISGKSVKDSDNINLKTRINDIDVLNLKYYQNNLNINMLPLGVCRTDSKLSWRIESIYDDWREPSDQRSITIANLPYGSYRLSMRLHDISRSRGATFCVSIPYDDKGAEQTDITCTPGKETTYIKAADPDETLLSQEKDQTIMIVEDNADLRMFLKNALDGTSFNVIVAGNGIVAWDIIRKKMPDIIISDVMMPEMDGFELCKTVKSTFETSHIPVILLTALSEKTEQLKGLGLGADDYITKPFDVAILKCKIGSFIRNRRIVKDNALRLINCSKDEVILSNEHNDKFLKDAVGIVNNNIANSNFGKDEFASALNVSSSLLYKKLKAITGQSPVDFIRVIRLKKSLELIQTRSYTITEVSELCGFSSVGYFGTSFRKFYGKSPSGILEKNIETEDVLS